MKACAGMSLRAMICLVALAMIPVSWSAATSIPAPNSVATSLSTVLPNDRKAVSSTTSHDFIRSSATERRTLSIRFADPLGDDMPVGLPAGIAHVFGPNGVSFPSAAAAEPYPARHVRPAATGPPAAA